MIQFGIERKNDRKWYVKHRTYLHFDEFLIDLVFIIF